MCYHVRFLLVGFNRNPEFEKANKGSGVAIEIPSVILEMVCAGLQILNELAVQTLSHVQAQLGVAPTNLELCHSMSRLLTFLGHLGPVRDDGVEDRLQKEVATLVGYFTLENTANQTSLQAGILPALCVFPMQYFIDARFVEVLYPTLLACSYKSDANTEVISREMSLLTLAKYLDGKVAAKSKEAMEAAESAKVQAAKAAKAGGKKGGKKGGRKEAASKSNGSGNGNGKGDGDGGDGDDGDGENASVSRFECRLRFPERLWEDASAYLKKRAAELA